MHRFRLPAVALALLTTTAGVAYAAASPNVSTGSATSIGTASAVLNGTVNPNGAKTTYNFDYGTTVAYGSVTTATSIGSGSKGVPATAKLTNLLPGTTYYYRLEATNTSGTGLGSGHTFRTTGSPPPGASTGTAVDVGTNSVTLTGIVNPEGAATTWAFQYGLTTVYGAQTDGQTIAGGAAPVPVTQVVTGLEAGATFHFRLVAFHGTTAAGSGVDATFETLPDPRPVPKIKASTTPRTAHAKPFRFITNGRISGPASTPGALDCIGDARVSYYLGKKRLRSSTAPIQPDCTFAASAAFTKLPKGGPSSRTVKLTIKIRFDGNGYLAPVAARTETVTLG